MKTVVGTTRSPRVRAALRLLSSCTALVALTALPAAAQASKEPIKIGTLFSMTGFGAVVGASSMTALNMVLKDINDAGGLLGRKVVVVQADDQSDATIAVGEAKRLAFREKVDFVVGPAFGTLAIATVPITTEAKIVHLTTAGAAELTPAFGPYHFSNFSSTRAQAEAMVNIALNDLGHKRPALLTDTSANSKGVIVEVKDVLAKRGMKLSGEQAFEPRTPDMTPQILSLRAANPDIIMSVSGSGEDAGLALKTLQDIGWNVRMESIALAFLSTAALKVAGNDAFEKAIGVTFRALTYCPNDPVGASDFAKFVGRIEAFAPDLKGKLAAPNALFTADQVSIIKAAVEATKSTEGPKVAAWIEQNAGSVKTIMGQMQASKDQHIMLSAGSFVGVTRPDQKRSDGLLRRAGC